MEKEVPENILAKIRKLLRLKESAIKIGSEGEAHAAAEAVNRLLTSYNLSLMDVTPEEQKNMISVSESEKPIRTRMGIFGKGICCGLYASIIFAGFCCMEVRLTWW